MSNNIGKNKELGNFLKSRREKIRPSQVGLPDNGRRRTPGLRREEVAVLAGIGTTWYTWLEQGRQISVSDSVLASVARALLLDSHETAYIFELAQLKQEKKLEAVVKADTMYQNFLDSLNYSPATMIDKYWNVIAWNKAAETVFINFADIDIVERNILKLMFTNEEYQSRFANWEKKAKRMLAVFRAECADTVNDIWLKKFIGDLEVKSTAFAKWWQLYDVAAEKEIRKIINHPQVGKLSFEHTVFLTPENNFKIYINTPEKATDTVDKMKILLN
ncbi:helix-turn-helix transcriptional regulator [Pectinatus sottacetonis]|uniref:helix-turn-helix transcriptional regulator n=1 Tax=Pectinatus sottacetonis TaxID=1002795 RepID=UPI0018C7B104|nr:helix-turn-helix transcriptional regulator [Pectinatus sottacetonis]